MFGKYFQRIGLVTLFCTYHISSTTYCNINSQSPRVRYLEERLNLRCSFFPLYQRLVALFAPSQRSTRTGRMTFFNFRLCRRNAQRWRRVEGNKTLLSACLLRRRRIGTCWQKHICAEPRFKAPCQVCLDSSLRRRRSGLRGKL